MVAYRALRSFGFADDGITVRMIAAGDVIDIPAAIAPGLVAAGNIAPLAPQVETSHIAGAPQTQAIAAAPVVKGMDVPADWQSLHWKRRVALAESIAGRKVAGAPEADMIIATELDARGLD